MVNERILDLYKKIESENWKREDLLSILRRCIRNAYDQIENFMDVVNNNM